jgi:tRNA A-37 threonylcarbamoyl transferase component Bud32
MDGDTQTYRTQSIGGLSWTYREGSEDLLAVDFTPETLTGADENRVRVRGRYEAGGRDYFVKVFKRAGAGRALKSMVLGHVAKNEFSASRYLSSRGIRTPEALAVGLSPSREDHAVIIFQAVVDAIPVRDLFLGARPDEREMYLDLIARTTAQLHRASFHHRDYHGGNLLVTTDEAGRPLLWVVDLHRSSFPRDMAGRRGVANIADILHSLLPALKQGDTGRFLTRYRHENPAARWDDAAARQAIEKRIGKIEERRLRSRTKRCFMNSSGFFVSRSRRWILYARRGVSGDEIIGLIGRFTRGVGRLIKRDRKASVALMPTDRVETCIKAYERLGPLDRIRALFGYSRGHRSWRAAEGMLLRGFNAPRHLCLAISRRFFIPRAVYLVTESIAPRLEMDRFILDNLGGGPSEARRRFVTGFGTVIGSLHRAGIYHRDLKATNIAVGKEGDDFSYSFLDLDAVSFGGPVSAGRRAKNLAQIFLSTPGLIDAPARRLFFEAYLAASGREEESQAIQRLVGNMVKGKDIIYVSRAGDVIEDARGLYEKLWGNDRHEARDPGDGPM